MEDPCWKGYEMIGTKKKNGKTVPNCVPKKPKSKMPYSNRWKSGSPFLDLIAMRLATKGK